MAKDSKPLTNDNDPSIAVLGNPETREETPIATRHDGGARAKAFIRAGWQPVNEKAAAIVASMDADAAAEKARAAALAVE